MNMRAKLTKSKAPDIKDRAQTEGGYDKASQTGACPEEQDDAEVVKGLEEDLMVFRVEEGAEGIDAASHIADAYGGGIGVAGNLAEGLDLHGA